jgi:hypothetical protein
MRTRSTTPRLLAAALVLAASLAGCSSERATLVADESDPAPEVTSDADDGPSTDSANASLSPSDSCYTARPFTAC